MRKAKGSLLTALLCLLLLVGSTGAQTDLAALRLTVDARLAELWQTILMRQALHYQMYGTFFQGIRTHNYIPNDGNESYPDNAGSKPTDQDTNWHDFMESELPGELPMALVVDTYDGPRGAGFSATVYVYANGKLYSRSKAIGPERLRLNSSWHEVRLSGEWPEVIK